MCFGGAEGIFDGIDAFVAETGHFDVGAYFGGLGRQTFGNIGEEFVFDGGRGESDFFPDIGVSLKGVSYFRRTGIDSRQSLRDGHLESIQGIAVFLI